MNPEWEIIPKQIVGIFQQIRRMRPLIHMIPNAVSASLCADGLSALGARPLMAIASQEMREITRQANASVINLGQPDLEKFRASEIVIEEAARSAKPLVLDPVGCGASGFRLRSTHRLLNMPWQGIVKGNCSEVYSIQQNRLTEEGVDAIAERKLSLQIPKGRVYLVTGREDQILWEGKSMRISHENRRCPEESGRYNIVGSGCLIGAVAGACYSMASSLELPIEEFSRDDTWLKKVTAALAASLGMAFSLEKANRASGYGMAKSALLDGLEKLAETEFEDWLRQKMEVDMLLQKGE